MSGLRGAVRLVPTTNTPPEGARPAPPTPAPFRIKGAPPARKAQPSCVIEDQRAHRRPAAPRARREDPFPPSRSASGRRILTLRLCRAPAHPSCQGPRPRPVLGVQRAMRRFTCLVGRSSLRRGCQRLARKAGAAGTRRRGQGPGEGAVALEEVGVRTNQQAAWRTPCPGSRFTGKVLLCQAGTGYLSHGVGEKRVEILLNIYVS